MNDESGFINSVVDQVLRRLDEVIPLKYHSIEGALGLALQPLGDVNQWSPTVRREVLPRLLPPEFESLERTPGNLLTRLRAEAAAKRDDIAAMSRILAASYTGFVVAFSAPAPEERQGLLRRLSRLAIGMIDIVADQGYEGFGVNADDRSRAAFAEIIGLATFSANIADAYPSASSGEP